MSIDPALLDHLERLEVMPGDLLVLRDFDADEISLGRLFAAAQERQFHVLHLLPGEHAEVLRPLEQGALWLKTPTLDRAERFAILANILSSRGFLAIVTGQGQDLKSLSEEELAMWGLQRIKEEGMSQSVHEAAI